jgi:hypothetical protein
LDGFTFFLYKKQRVMKMKDYETKEFECHTDGQEPAIVEFIHTLNLIQEACKMIQTKEVFEGGECALIE